MPNLKSDAYPNQMPNLKSDAYPFLPQTLAVKIDRNVR